MEERLLETLTVHDLRWASDALFKGMQQVVMEEPTYKPKAKPTPRPNVKYCNAFAGDASANWKAHCNKAEGHRGKHRNGKLEWRNK